MRSNRGRLAILALTCLWCVPAFCEQPAFTPDYDQLVRTANTLFKEDKLAAARQTTDQAIKADGKRYEAYVVAAKIASKLGDTAQAKQWVEKAVELAPSEVKDKVRQLADHLSQTAPSSNTSPSSSLSREDKRKYDDLILIVDDVKSAPSPEERTKVWRQYLKESADFLALHPDQTNLWLYRAIAALDLGDPGVGRLAGEKLKELGVENSNDASARKVLLRLDRQGWLGGEPARPGSSPAGEDSTSPASTALNEAAVIKTSMGDMVIEFWPDAAPKTVENFKTLARKGFYDGTAFHRIIKGFMIQGGDPLTKDSAKEALWGTGGPGYKIKAEFNDHSHQRGVISMARSSNPDSAGSQFFICDGSASFLDRKYTAFGELVKGDDVLEKIASTPVTKNGAERSKPLSRIEVQTIKIVPADSIR